MRRSRHSSGGDRDRDRDRSEGAGEKRRKTEPFSGGGGSGARGSASHHAFNRDRGGGGRDRDHNSSNNNERSHSSHRSSSHQNNATTSSSRGSDLRNGGSSNHQHRRSSPSPGQGRGRSGGAGGRGSFGGKFSPSQRPSPRKGNVDFRSQSPRRDFRNRQASPNRNHNSNNNNNNNRNNYRGSPPRVNDRGRRDDDRRGGGGVRPSPDSSRSRLPVSVSGNSRNNHGRGSSGIRSSSTSLRPGERHGDSKKGDESSKVERKERPARTSAERERTQVPTKKSENNASEKVGTTDLTKAKSPSREAGTSRASKVDSPLKTNGRLSGHGNFRRNNMLQRRNCHSDRMDNNHRTNRITNPARSNNDIRKTTNNFRPRITPGQNRSRNIGARAGVNKFVPSPSKKLSPRKPGIDNRSQQGTRAGRNLPQRNHTTPTFRVNNLRTTLKAKGRDGDKKGGMTAAPPRSKLPLAAGVRARNKLVGTARNNKLRNQTPGCPRSKLPTSVGGSSRSKLPMSGAGNSRSTPNSIPPMSTTSPKLTLEELHCDNNNADDYDELTKVDKWVRSAPDELYYVRQVDGLAVATERTQTLCEKFEATLLLKSKAAREEAEVLGAVKMTELIAIENAQLIEQRKMKKMSKMKRKCGHGNNSCKDKNNKKHEGCPPLADNTSSSSSPVPDSISTNCSSAVSLHSDQGDRLISKKQLTEGNEHQDDKVNLAEAGMEVQRQNEQSRVTSTSQQMDNSVMITVVEVRSEISNKSNSSFPHLPSPDLSQGDKITLLTLLNEESMEEGELSDSSDEEVKSCLTVSKAIKEPLPDDKPQITLTVALPSRSSSKMNPVPSTSPVTPVASEAKSTALALPQPSSGSKDNCCAKKDKVKTEQEKAQQPKQKVLKKKKSRTTPKASSSDSEIKDANNGSDGENSSSSSSDEDDDSGSSSSSDSEGGFSMTRSDTANRELERRKKHPRRLHTELWHNDPGLMNDGPVCRCSAKARRFGIRHGFYPGEEKLSLCNSFTNNKDTLYHYRITISPPKNFLISTPTVINHDGHEYIFEGFSIFSHSKLDLTLPPCKVIRFNIRYDVFIEEERFPESFCVKELLLFETYLFREILELVDLKYELNEETGCSQFHLMPRFVRQLPDNGQEILSMSRVLIHLLKSDKEIVKEEDLPKLYTVEQTEWQNFADRHKGTIVTKWGMKPCAIRVDQIDRDVSGREIMEDEGIPFPLIVHFGIRPPQLSYAGNAGYQRAWRRYVKYRHLLSNMPKPSPEDKLKLLNKEMKLQAMRTASNMKRDVTVAISSKGFRTTGICCDLVQHAMLIPVLVAHLRFHKCLKTLESTMNYTFNNRYLLQLAMTHPSYRENFGTNPDHARNALTNGGIRQPEYGDRKIHYASTRKRGINTLINIMAKFGAIKETESDITHNERLEFLGDAVVEFVTSIHLFHIFPDLEEGGLATYRAAIVQNQHLAVLAQALGLDQYMLYAHGSDLCHDSELRHAMANCFEALMGALFLDGGIEAADRVFGKTLFHQDDVLLNLWTNYPKHPLQQEEPTGDREWIKDYGVLQKLAQFEDSIGVEFRHIRLLARAFTDRSLGYNNLTRGSNQRLEFLGDTVLQLISSEYLYRHFPDHHEGHLSLLRSSLVNNRTQSIVCDDLGMFLYAMRGDPKSEMKTKDRADLLEAFLGALYIDKGLLFCIRFCQVCFFPRLNTSITKQEWNDPKSKLQQCCLTLRAMDGREPDIPVYKVTESLGPTNTRTYIVAVYFRGRRLATAQGHSIQEAEMNAAALALEVSGHLFPQLHHQRRIMDKTKCVKKGH